MENKTLKTHGIKIDVRSRLISEAILNDKQLQALHAERANIYSLATPTVVLKEDGEAETIWIDETNHPNLSKINEMIEHRTEQIKNFYCPVMDEETYLSISGASRQDIGDSAFHKNKGSHSDKTWSKMIDAQCEKDRRLIAKRDELRKEYRQKVENGEIRPQTRNEKLIETANGNPDNECVIASRRLLEKKGIDWRKQNGK